MQLTQRQCEVADRLLAGMTIAAIADDLDLTESRVNQIIRALKNRFEVGTQAGIVAAYQRALETGLTQSETAEDLSDAAGAGDESLVPQVLNTPHPLLYRLVAICLAALTLAITFLALTQFAVTLNDAMSANG
ncbi:LuxR C-terminal-related transcriptional regulator [Qipengyuania sp. ASV99]|uniref:LuxR C-terminal-related transcriptional regulator n=1 Tax=Qipengyuania sp. ASV99 TaxID=3399681 RepID=UPI003A4C5316